MDRLIGLVGVEQSLIDNLEGKNKEGVKRLPPRMATGTGIPFGPGSSQDIPGVEIVFCGYP